MQQMYLFKPLQLALKLPWKCSASRWRNRKLMALNFKTSGREWVEATLTLSDIYTYICVCAHEGVCGYNFARFLDEWIVCERLISKECTVGSGRASRRRRHKTGEKRKTQYLSVKRFLCWYCMINRWHNYKAFHWFMDIYSCPQATPALFDDGFCEVSCFRTPCLPSSVSKRNWFPYSQEHYTK